MVTTLTELLRFQLVPEAAISILGKLMSRDIRLNDATAHKLLLVKLSLNTSRLTQTCTAHQHVQLTNLYSSPTCTSSLSTAAVRNIFPSDKRLRFWLESHTNNASPFPYNACYFSAILP